MIPPAIDAYLRAHDGYMALMVFGPIVPMLLGLIWVTFKAPIGRR